MNLMVKFQNNYRFFCVKVAKMCKNIAFCATCITLFINIISRNTIIRTVPLMVLFWGVLRTIGTIVLTSLTSSTP